MMRVPAPGNGEGSGRCDPGARSTIQYDRNDMDLNRGCFPCARRCDWRSIRRREANICIRVEFFGDEIDRITEVDPLQGRCMTALEHVTIFPASHYVVPQEKINKACDEIEKELEEQSPLFQRRR